MQVIESNETFCWASRCIHYFVHCIQTLTPIANDTLRSYVARSSYVVQVYRYVARGKVSLPRTSQHRSYQQEEMKNYGQKEGRAFCVL